MEDRRRGGDYRYRERSPISSSRYRDRSPDRYSERSSDKYRSSRYRNRSRSRSRSFSRDRRVDRYRSKSRSRRSTSRGRYRSSRSRSPRHKYQSSKYSSSKNRHYHKSKSISRSPSPSHSPRLNKDRDQYRPSTKEELIAPPPPSFRKDYDDSNGGDKCENVKSDSRDNTSDHRNESPTSSSSSLFALYSKSTENSASDAAQFIETDLNEEDKERIHREMEEKLRLALAKEGKIYPPPKPEASHPVFANDGSFLEIFKKMQEQMAQQQANALAEQRARNLPLCKRRGGKILKTGIVAKSRASDSNNVDPKDFWSIYLQEVKKYKSASCDVDSQTRPLVK